MTDSVLTMMNTWVIVIHYADGSILSEGGFAFYEITKGDALQQLQLKGWDQELGDKFGVPITHIEIR